MLRSEEKKQEKVTNNTSLYSLKKHLYTGNNSMPLRIEDMDDLQFSTSSIVKNKKRVYINTFSTLIKTL